MVFHFIIDPSTCRMGEEAQHKKSWVCFTSVFDHLYNNPGCIQLQLGERESDPYWSKYSEKKEGGGGGKNPADIFIYERAEVWRGSKKKKM